MAKTPFDSLPKSIYTVMDEGKEWHVHSQPFKLGFAGYDPTTKRGLWTLSRTDVHFRPAQAIAASIETFCQRVQQGLAQATFAQRRQLVELLIDRVIVDDGQVEIRYVIPTSEAGAQTRFCHLRKDYFSLHS